MLGVDFAHVGRRYGDGRAARAYQGPLATVAERDDARVERIAAGDAEGFWNLLMERGDDDLKWCGSSPMYTFLRAVPQARGRRLAYEQWNIDDASVVSFGALSLQRRIIRAAGRKSLTGSCRARSHCQRNRVGKRRVGAP